MSKRLFCEGSCELLVWAYSRLFCYASCHPTLDGPPGDSGFATAASHTIRYFLFVDLLCETNPMRFLFRQCQCRVRQHTRSRTMCRWTRPCSPGNPGRKWVFPLLARSLCCCMRVVLTTNPTHQGDSTFDWIVHRTAHECFINWKTIGIL